MRHFLKFHLRDGRKTPILINVDNIVWIRKDGGDPEAVLWVNDHEIEVREKYKAVEKVIAGFVGISVMD